MDAFKFEIARFLAARAGKRSRATYQQVGDAVGWNHPNGRGLGSHLEAILHWLSDHRLPPLTTILVKKGHRHPAEDAMAYIRSALGDIDIDAAQEAVFDFDWTSVPDLAPSRPSPDRDVWLTSFWGFAPDQWGCIGFADENRRNRFLSRTGSRTLVAIYVTKAKGPEEMRGKVVGVLEVSRTTGHASEFISGDRWAEKERDPASRGKWPFAIQATRAWRIVPEDWRRVEDLLPQAYASAHPELIGASGVKMDAVEAERLFELDAYEVPVYGQTGPVDTTITTLETALSPSRAISPPTAPYIVGETDGPKHLYILKLQGDTAAWLGRPAKSVDGRWIIKVGFSRSPLTRRDQIQSAYPRGAFQWSVLRPADLSLPAPYSNARVAIAGEDAMKARLVDEKAEVLGGEFFLAEEWLVHKTWTAGRVAAERAEQSLASASASARPSA